MRADNQGEGGILALTALVMPRVDGDGRAARTCGLVLLGVFGTALLYGDGLITPAISVLSRRRGLRGRVVGASSGFVHPDRLRDPRRPVRRPAAGHRRHRQGLRAR